MSADGTPGIDDAERLRLVLSHLREYAVIWLDPEGRVELWNAGAEAIKGYRADEVVGHSFSIFYTPEDRERGLPERLLEKAARDGEVEHRGWRVRKDGARFWADTVITALMDARGGLTGFLKVTRDRTEEHRVEQEHDRFFAALAHDL